MTTFCPPTPPSKTGARGSGNKEVRGRFQASSSARAWGSVWPAAQMEPEQKRRAVLRAAPWLAAWTAPHQRAQAGEDGGAVGGRAVGAAQDGDRGSRGRSCCASNDGRGDLWCVNIHFGGETGRRSWRKQLQSQRPAGRSDREDAGEEVWSGTAHTGTGDPGRVAGNNMLFPPGLVLSWFWGLDITKQVSCFSFSLLCCCRSWSLSVQREERGTCLYWGMSNIRLFVPQILRLCWRAVLDSWTSVAVVGWRMLGSDILLLFILCEIYGLCVFVFKVAIKTIHPLNNINLFSYCSIDILKVNALPNVSKKNTKEDCTWM